jgi:hypothetical protein
MMLGLLFSSGHYFVFFAARRLDTLFLAIVLDVPAMAVTSCITALFTGAVTSGRYGCY